MRNCRKEKVCILSALLVSGCLTVVLLEQAVTPELPPPLAAPLTPTKVELAGSEAKTESQNYSTAAMSTISPELSVEPTLTEAGLKAEFERMKSSQKRYIEEFERRYSAYMLSRLRAYSEVNAEQKDQLAKMFAEWAPAFPPEEELAVIIGEEAAARFQKDWRDELQDSVRKKNLMYFSLFRAYRVSRNLPLPSDTIDDIKQVIDDEAAQRGTRVGEIESLLESKKMHLIHESLEGGANKEEIAAYMKELEDIEKDFGESIQSTLADRLTEKFGAEYSDLSRYTARVIVRGPVKALDRSLETEALVVYYTDMLKLNSEQIWQVRASLLEKDEEYGLGKMINESATLLSIYLKDPAEAMTWIADHLKQAAEFENKSFSSILTDEQYNEYVRSKNGWQDLEAIQYFQ